MGNKSRRNTKKQPLRTIRRRGRDIPAVTAPHAQHPQQPPQRFSWTRFALVVKKHFGPTARVLRRMGQVRIVNGAGRQVFVSLEEGLPIQVLKSLIEQEGLKETLPVPEKEKEPKPAVEKGIAL